MAQTGNRSHHKITYDRDFLILTLPSTRKGTAKVTPGRGGHNTRERLIGPGPSKVPPRALGKRGE
jgi:hypothetical protein